MIMMTTTSTVITDTNYWCSLAPYSTALFLLCLQTYIGQVVVSVNPYKDLGIYTETYLEKYRNVNFYEVPPHV